MRINVYAEELTKETELVTKTVTDEVGAMNPREELARVARCTEWTEVGPWGYRTSQRVPSAAAKAIVDALLAPELREVLLRAMGGEQVLSVEGRNPYTGLHAVNLDTPLWRFPLSVGGTEE